MRLALFPADRQLPNFATDLGLIEISGEGQRSGSELDTGGAGD
jgi:hypothetical protein